MKETIIECDGGTPCNIPSLGYGDGYGSYRIDKGEVVRIDFKRPMSNNDAEVNILIRAIKDAILKFGSNQSFSIYSDSKNIVNRVNQRSPKKSGLFSKGSSNGYKKGCFELRGLLFAFQSQAHWTPRENMVKIFGH